MMMQFYFSNDMMNYIGCFMNVDQTLHPRVIKYYFLIN